MKQLLVDFDSTIPNLALMKLSAWAKNRGDQVRMVKVNWSSQDEPRVPLTFYEDADEAWVSCLFTWHGDHARRLSHPMAKMHYGGTGLDWGKDRRYEFRAELPLEVELGDPDYSIYPGDTRAVGFCNRGCNRACQFCDVPKKEGRIIPSLYRRVIDWVPPDRRNILLLDNDIGFYPDWQHDQIIEDARSIGAKLSITQGYDLRCVVEKPYRAAIMVENKPWTTAFDKRRLYTAWDYLGVENYVRRGLEILLDAGFKGYEIETYMISGDLGWHNSKHGGSPTGCARCHAEAYYRYRILWEEYGVWPYVMVYNNRKDDLWLVRFKKWVNRRIHKNYTLESWFDRYATPVPNAESYKQVAPMLLSH